MKEYYRLVDKEESHTDLEENWIVGEVVVGG